MKDNKNLNVLNTIYKTSEMGIVGINDVIDKAKKEEFRDFLNEQRKKYEDVIRDADELFIMFGAKEKELGSMAKVSSKVMSEMKLMGEEKDEIIAKMMMEGTNKGVIKINKTLNDNPDIDKDVFNLAQNLLEEMENNLEELKVYL